VQSHSRSSSQRNYATEFNENDRELLEQINTTVNEMKIEVNCIKQELKSTKLLNQVKKETERLHQTINLIIFKNDELDQVAERI